MRIETLLKLKWSKEEICKKLSAVSKRFNGGRSALRRVSLNRIVKFWEEKKLHLPRKKRLLDIWKVKLNVL